MNLFTIAAIKRQRDEQVQFHKNEVDKLLHILAMFIMNKRPGSDWYYDEYRIPPNRKMIEEYKVTKRRKMSSFPLEVSP